MAARALCLLLVGTLRAGAQCVELPYPAMPPQLWERELVWMKNIGVACVALPDAAGLSTLLPLARRLDLPVWVLADGPSAELLKALEPQTESHGGPIRWIGRNAAPGPLHMVSALDPKALVTARNLFETHTGTVLWTDVESRIAPSFHRGAISFAGEEQPGVSALRRDTQLFNQWQPFLAKLAPGIAVRMVSGKLPAAVSARQFVTADASAASAVSIVNRGTTAFHGELRVQYPPVKQAIKLPAVTVPAGDALWLPVNLPLVDAHHCPNCNAFGKMESIVYSTAELTQVEFENGILAFEFSAPAPGEIVLHLAAEPAGPYLAAGKPRTFDWDAGPGRVRLPFPAGTGPQHRVRIGLALAAPETAAFFGDTKFLLIGQANKIGTLYSSPDVATRSRLRAPSWLKTEANADAPNHIDYTVTVPPTALHGSHVTLALETDGTQMSHTRLQLLRPVSVRVREALSRHYGPNADLPIDPILVATDQAGRDLNIVVRNNAPEIRTFTLEAVAPEFEFAQQRTEMVIAASSERNASLHLFSKGAAPGLHQAMLKLSGAATLQIPFRILVIPRGGAARYQDGDATVLESQAARAVFTADRWTEFVWKDSEVNLLPEGGVALGAARPQALTNADLLFEGSVALQPAERNNVVLAIKPGAGNTTYSLYTSRR